MKGKIYQKILQKLGPGPVYKELSATSIGNSKF